MHWPPRQRHDLTEWNAANSPLLRLPAELRNEIWKYAFASLRIHPKYKTNQYDDVPDHQTGLIERRRDEPLAPRTYVFPIVCKQLCAEILPIIYSECTFAFDDPMDFKHFVMSHRSRADQVSHLEIHVHKFHKLWGALTMPWFEFATKFTSLCGFNLIYEHKPCTEANDMKSWIETQTSLMMIRIFFLPQCLQMDKMLALVLDKKCSYSQCVFHKIPELRYRPRKDSSYFGWAWVEELR